LFLDKCSRAPYRQPPQIVSIGLETVKVPTEAQPARGGGTGVSCEEKITTIVDRAALLRYGANSA
jgi:hypothetical protein